MVLYLIIQEQKVILSIDVVINMYWLLYDRY